MRCSIDGEVTTNLKSDPDMGWLHRNTSGWHTVTGTPVVKRGGVYVAVSQPLPNAPTRVAPDPL